MKTDKSNVGARLCQCKEPFGGVLNDVLPRRSENAKAPRVITPSGPRLRRYLFVKQ
jgi:hypothetical protein